MQVAEVKTNSAAQNLIQTKRQPFFSKEGEGLFFSKSSESTTSFFNPVTVQPKLTIGQPNDKYEVEADAMADKVVQRLATGHAERPPASEVGRRSTLGGNTAVQAVQPKCTECAEEENLQKKQESLINGITKIQRKPIFESNAEMAENHVQRKPFTSPVAQPKCSTCEGEENQQKKEEELLKNESELQTKIVTGENPLPPEDDGNVQTKAGDGQTAPSDLQSRLNSSKGGGSTLSPDTQKSMGSAFGADFKNVMVHTGNDAVQMNKDLGAQAFTHGNDIYFNQGKYDINSGSGKHLLAHELTHTVQQGAGITAPCIQRRIVMRTSSQQLGAIGSSSGTSESLRPLTTAEVESYINDIGTVHHDYDDIISGTGEEFGFVASESYRRGLIVSIIRNLHQVTTDLFFDNYREAVREVRKRALISLIMRASQGQSRGLRPTGYPRSCGTDPGPRVSQAAGSYWTVRSGEHYWFELTSDGRGNAYEALRTLIFNHQSSVCLRTLMHCDYMISAQQFFVMADSMGATDFNQAVRDGNINLVIRWNSFENIVADTPTSDGEYQSLQTVNLSSESEFIIGDHVMFYNHDAFDDLNLVHNNVRGNMSNWRLENAIVTDIDSSNEFRFQGHGYFSPKRRSAFVTAMVSKMNELVTAVEAAIAAGNTDQLSIFLRDSSSFQVVRWDGSDWSIHFHEGLGTTRGQPVLDMPLRRYSAADYPNPFVAPGESNIQVRRPIESRRESIGDGPSGGGTTPGSASPVPEPVVPTPATPAPLVAPRPASPAPSSAKPSPRGRTTTEPVPQSDEAPQQQHPPDPVIDYVDMSEEIVSADNMNCDVPTKARNLTQYSFLIRCLETQLATTHGPVDILRTLRELYYGGEKFDNAACGDSQSGTVASLRQTAPLLMNALSQSKVISGVDVGHIFTGLEGMLCPRTETDPVWYAPSVNMSNEDFLTWGGDIGSAAAGRLNGYNASGWIFKDDPSWDRYFLKPDTYASREDLLGDIDAFVFRANLRGVPCSSTKDARMPAPNTPISRLFLDFYGAPPGVATGLTSSDRFRCFTEATGGVISGTDITNKPSLVDRYWRQVFSFARLFYLSLDMSHIVTLSAMDLVKLMQYSRDITARFFNWIDNEL